MQHVTMYFFYQNLLSEFHGEMISCIKCEFVLKYINGCFVGGWSDLVLLFVNLLIVQ